MVERSSNNRLWFAVLFPFTSKSVIPLVTLFMLYEVLFSVDISFCVAWFRFSKRNSVIAEGSSGCEELLEQL